MTHLTALRVGWRWGAAAAALPLAAVVAWFLMQPVVYEAHAVVQGATAEATGDLLLYLSSRTVAERAGARPGEALGAVPGAGRGASCTSAATVTARALSAERAVLLAREGIRYAEAALIAKAERAIAGEQAEAVRLLRMTAIFSGEPVMIREIVERAKRAAIGVTVIDAPVADVVPRLTSRGVAGGLMVGLALGVCVTYLRAWWSDVITRPGFRDERLPI